MSVVSLWVFDPDGRWASVVRAAARGRPVEVAHRLPAPPDARPRLVDLDHPGLDPVGLRAITSAAGGFTVGLTHDAAPGRVERALALGVSEVVTGQALTATSLARALSRAHARASAEAERDARRAAEMAAFDATLATFGKAVSHDLRAPIRSIDGFGQALIEDYGEVLDGDARLYLDRMRKATGRLERRIAALLRLTQMIRRPFEAASIDLVALADEVVERLVEDHPGREIDWSRPPELSTVGDRRLLRVLLVELLDNAWKFTGDGPARISLDAEGGVFSVTDDGVGFAPSFAGRAFEAFARYHTPQEFPGAGVGLAVARCAVERHGGWIRVTSEEGRGARVDFTLQAGIARPGPSR